MKFKIGDRVYCTRHRWEGTVRSTDSTAVLGHPLEIYVDDRYGKVSRYYTQDGSYMVMVEPSLIPITKLHRLLKEVNETES